LGRHINWQVMEAPLYSYAQAPWFGAILKGLVLLMKPTIRWILYQRA
jgi:hypothetical protein